MKNNVKTLKTPIKPNVYSNPRHYTLKQSDFKARPTPKKNSVISSNHLKESDKKILPHINSHRQNSSIRKPMTKREVQVKEKTKEDPDPEVSMIKPKAIEEPIDSSLRQKISDSEAQLKKINDDTIMMKTLIGQNEKKNINILRDIDNRDSYISIKNCKLSKLKKQNNELKEKLEELNNKYKEDDENEDEEDNENENEGEGNGQQEDNNNNNNSNEANDNPIEELFFRLIASCQYARDDQEEEKPLDLALLEKITVLTYNANIHSDTKKCLLCNFELCTNDLIMQIPSCHHIFHNACLVNHFQKNNICPNCKEEVKDI